MIENIKTGIIIILAIGLWWLNHSYESYKENIRDQVQKNVSEKTRIESEQRERYLKSQRDLVVSNSRLDSAIKRVRDLEAMSRREGVQVAECGPNAMPRTPENTAGTDEETALADGVRQTAFYAAAMKDINQCSRLIEFVTQKHPGEK